MNEKDTKKPDERTFFEIGSVTKVFTGIALARLVEDGNISLEDSIASSLPAGITCPTRAGKPITFLELATHTSGLPRLPENMKPENPANPTPVIRMRISSIASRKFASARDMPTPTTDSASSGSFSRARQGNLMRRLSPIPSPDRL